MEGSTLSDTIVETNARIQQLDADKLARGHSAVIEGIDGEVTIGDHSEMHVTSVASRLRRAQRLRMCRPERRAIALPLS